MRVRPHPVSPQIGTAPSGRVTTRRSAQVFALAGDLNFDVFPPRLGVDADRFVAQWAKLESRLRMLLTEDMALIWVDPRIHALLLAEWSLSLRCGRLFGGSQRARQILRDFIPTLGCELSVASFPSKHANRKSLIVLGRIIDHAGQTLVGLELKGANGNTDYRCPGVREAFGLTVAEERVVQQLLDGRTAAMIATELRITLDTTRSHIRQIYSKIGVNSREALFNQLRAYWIE